MKLLWVPETFHARFSVSVKSLFRVPAAREKTSGTQATVKQIQVVRAGLEPGASGLQVRRPDHKNNNNLL